MSEPQARRKHHAPRDQIRLYAAPPESDMTLYLPGSYETRAVPFCWGRCSLTWAGAGLFGFLVVAGLYAALLKP